MAGTNWVNKMRKVCGVMALSVFILASFMSQAHAADVVVGRTGWAAVANPIPLPLRPGATQNIVGDIEEVGLATREIDIAWCFDRIVTGDAIGNVGSRAAVKFEAVMASVTSGVVDNFPFEQGRAADGYKVDDAVGRNRCLAAYLDAETVSLGAVKHRSASISVKVIGESVLVGTIAVVDKSACRSALSVRLGIRDAAAGARDIGLPLA